MAKKNSKRREWSRDDIRDLKALARQKTPARKIARTLKRSGGATRQKAFSLGESRWIRVSSLHCCIHNSAHLRSDPPRDCLKLTSS
jgi:hypothetical protein